VTAELVQVGGASLALAFVNARPWDKSMPGLDSDWFD
jgi:hypothetical protein